MDISTLGIPNLRVRNIGSKRDPIEFVEATITLPAWDGYLKKHWENGRLITDGTIIVNFACNSRCTREDWDPQVAAYHQLLEHQDEIRDRINQSVMSNIDHLKGYLDENDPGVPNIRQGSPGKSAADPSFTNELTADQAASTDNARVTDFDLRPFIGPRSISILEETKDGVAYVEWFLNCTWDDEHGLAAVTHQSRLIDLDRGETDIYKIFADNGTLEDELRMAELLRNQPRPTPRNPWWKFW